MPTSPTEEEPINNVYYQMRKLVGIRGFTTNTPPIKGRIKEDIADFIVQEILPSGEILSTRPTNQSKKNKNRTSTVENYSKKEQRFTTFTLVKKNADTIYAAEIIRDYLKVKEGDLQWAGIKDHTAITAQRFSVRGNFINKLQHFYHPNISISNISLSRHAVKLGHLWGNHFTINIRHINKDYEEIKPILNEWKKQINERGFPNYYGMQRFGQHRPNSHIVGKYLFMHQYKEAVEEFLFTVYPLEFEKIREARIELSEKAKKGIWDADLPRSLHYEKRIVHYLNEHPDDYKGAILKLPSSLINLIFSSFQSYLFNSAVSYRLEQRDTLHQPINGDIVSILKDEYGHPSLVFYRYHGGDGWNDTNIIKAFQHHRAAIVAPILGYKTKLDEFPSFQHIYTTFLNEYDFTLKYFDHKIPGLFSFEGTFRAINNYPTNLKISQAHVINHYPKLDPHGIKLEFSLPKGTYATMLLAELRKHFIDFTKS
ncbi:MAG: tRNA pseudouridine(13) synthase TruD [Promethearchaeota archaeon]